jgi:hypothetical protein
MATPFSDIYIKTNILFEDAGLLSKLTDTEYEELLELFLSKSKSIYFKSCEKDLTDVDNILKQFNETLSEQEQWVLATGIRLVWLERKLYNEENLRNKLSNRDYQTFSPANLIDKLILLRDKTEKDLQKLIVDYSFDSFVGFN